jgi:hypothetical protein
MQQSLPSAKNATIVCGSLACRPSRGHVDHDRTFTPICADVITLNSARKVFGSAMVAVMLVLTLYTTRYK